MKPGLLLKIAAALMVFHIAGHTFGHMGWRSSTDPVQQEVIRHMTAYSFPFMGAVHSLGDYYEGYGWNSSVAMIFFVLMFWFMSSAYRENTLLVKKMLITLCLCLVVWGVIELIFFFPFAASITWAAALSGLIAYIRIGKTVS